MTLTWFFRLEVVMRSKRLDMELCWERAAEARNALVGVSSSLYAQRGQPENSIVGFRQGQSAYIGQRPYNPVLQRAEEVVNDWE